MKKTKVCFFVPFYPIVKGGGEYQARIISNELAKYHNFEIFFISVNDKIEDVIYHDGFKIYLIVVKPSIYSKLSFYYELNSKVNEILVNEGPEIVYQRILNTFSYRLSNWLHKRNIPYVLHIADNYSIQFKGLRGYFKQKLFKKILENRTTIVCQTEYQRLTVKELDQSKDIAVIPNMHPLINLKPGRVKDKNKIVWIGNVRPVKQLETYIELAHYFNNEQYVFNIIGNIPEGEYGNTLKNSIDSSANICYHGIKDNIFINDFLQDCAVLINTSHSEGFSNTFIQAWMCGTPVISLNSDPDGIISEHNLGRICEGRFSLLTKNLSEILNDKEYKALSDRCISVSRNQFLIENNIAKFIEILKNSNK